MADLVPMPSCLHDQGFHERSCWPTGIPVDGEPHASTYVCNLPGCKEAAAAWVLYVTGHEAVIVPLEDRS
jgi:hypothetical protein